MQDTSKALIGHKIKNVYCSKNGILYIITAEGVVFEFTPMGDEYDNEIEVMQYPLAEIPFDISYVLGYITKEEYAQKLLQRRNNIIRSSRRQG